MISSDFRTEARRKLSGKWSKAVFIVLGIEFEGKPEVLAFDIQPSETKESWLNIFRSLTNRGLKLFKLDENIEDYEIQHGISGENNVKSIPVYCENKKFSNARELADYYELNYKTIKNWVNGYNPMPKEWYDKGLRREDKTMSDYKIQVPQFKKVFCENRLN